MKVSSSFRNSDFPGIQMPAFANVVLRREDVRGINEPERNDKNHLFHL